MKKTVVIRESRRGFLRRTRLYVVTEPAMPTDEVRAVRHADYDLKSPARDFPRRQGGAYGEPAVVVSDESPAVRRR